MTKVKTVSVNIPVKLEDIEDLLYSAAQGSAYWAVSSELAFESTVQGVLYQGKKVLICDEEAHPKAKTHELTLEKIVRGLRAMAKNEPYHLANILEENTDMHTGDALLQCSLFGKVIYS